MEEQTPITITDINSNKIHEDITSALRLLISFLNLKGTVYNASNLEGMNLEEIKNLIQEQITEDLTTDNKDSVVITDADGNEIIVNKEYNIYNTYRTDISVLSELKVKTLNHIPIQVTGDYLFAFIPEDVVSVIALFLDSDLSNPIDLKDRPFIQKYEVLTVYDTNAEKNVTRVLLNEDPTFLKDSDGNLKHISIIFTYKNITTWDNDYTEVPDESCETNIDITCLKQQKNNSISFVPQIKNTVNTVENHKIINEKIFNNINISDFEISKFFTQEFTKIVNEVNNPTILNGFDKSYKVQKLVKELVKFSKSLESNTIPKLEESVKLITKIEYLIKQVEEGNQNFLNQDEIYKAFNKFKIMQHIVTLYSMQSYDYKIAEHNHIIKKIFHVIRNLITNGLSIQTDKNFAYLINHFINQTDNKLLDIIPEIAAHSISNVIRELKTYEFNKKIFINQIETYQTINNVILQKQQELLLSSLFYNSPGLFYGIFNIILQKDNTVIDFQDYDTIAKFQKFYEKVCNIIINKISNVINKEKYLQYILPIGKNSNYSNSNKIVKQIVYRPIPFDLKNPNGLQNTSDFYLIEYYDKWGYYNRALGLQRYYNKSQDITCSMNQTHFRAEYNHQTLDVFLEGILLKKDVDYIANNNKDIYLNIPAKEGYLLQIRSQEVFETVDSFTKNETLDLIREQKLEQPIIKGTTEIFEGTLLSLYILNYDANTTYSVTGSNIYIPQKNIKQDYDRIDILLPETEGQVATINIIAQKEGYWNSYPTQHMIIIKDFYSEADVDIIYSNLELLNTQLFTIENGKQSSSSTSIEQDDINLPLILESKPIQQSDLELNWDSVKVKTEMIITEIPILESAINENNRTIYTTQNKIILDTHLLNFKLEQGLQLLLWEDDLVSNLNNNILSLPLKPIILNKLYYSDENAIANNGFEYAIIDISEYFMSNPIKKIFLNTETIIATKDKKGRTTFNDKIMLLSKIEQTEFYNPAYNEFKIDMDKNPTIVLEDLYNNSVEIPVGDSISILPIKNIRNEDEFSGLIESNNLSSSSLSNFDIKLFSGCLTFERDSYIYLTKGYYNGIVNHSIYRFDTRSKMVHKLTDIPDNRRDYAIDITGNISSAINDALIYKNSLLGTRIFVSGGFNIADHKIRNDILMYEVDTDTWTPLVSDGSILTDAHYWAEHNIVTIKDSIYLFNGLFLDQNYVAPTNVEVNVRDHEFDYDQNLYHNNYDFRLDYNNKYSQETVQVYPVYNFKSGLDENDNPYFPITKLEFNVNTPINNTLGVQVELWETDIDNNNVQELVKDNSITLQPNIAPTSTWTITNDELQILDKIRSTHDFDISNNNMIHTPIFIKDYGSSSGGWSSSGGYYYFTAALFSGLIGKLPLQYTLIKGEKYKLRLRAGHEYYYGSFHFKIAGNNFTYYKVNYAQYSGIPYSDWDSVLEFEFIAKENTTQMEFYAGNNYRIYKAEIFDSQVYKDVTPGKKLYAYRVNAIIKQAYSQDVIVENTNYTKNVYGYNIQANKFFKVNEFPTVLAGTSYCKKENLIYIMGGLNKDQNIKYDKSVSINLNRNIFIIDITTNTIDISDTLLNIDKTNIPEENLHIPNCSYFPTLGLAGDYIYYKPGIELNNLNVLLGENVYTSSEDIYCYHIYQKKWYKVNFNQISIGSLIYIDPNSDNRILSISGGISDLNTNLTSGITKDILKEIFENKTVYSNMNKTINIFKNIYYFFIENFPFSLDHTKIAQLKLKAKIKKLIPFSFTYKENKTSNYRSIITDYGKFSSEGLDNSYFNEFKFRWSGFKTEKLKNIILSFTKLRS